MANELKPVEELELDKEATAENIARHISKCEKSGRLHEPTYNAAKAGALMALECLPSEKVAPVEGLETVLERPYLGSLVARSQAEAIIAAERAAIPILKGTAFKSGDGWKDTTKEGEICFVWNKMLQKPHAPGQYPRVGKEHWSASTENFTFEPATPDEVVTLFSLFNAALTARVKELENINANLMGDDEDKPRYTTKRLKQEIARETKALETQLAAAKKALEAIEDHSTRCETLSSHSSTAVAYLKDIQQEARAALEGKP